MINIKTEDAKTAIVNKKPVIANNLGLEYEHITGLIYRYNQDTKKWIVSAELKDKNTHSVTIARLDKISLLEE